MANDCHAVERRLIVAYLRHLATLRPADANGLRVAASDVEARFHCDVELNPTALEVAGDHVRRLN